MLPPPASARLLLLVAFLTVRNVVGKTFENRIIGKPFVACRTDAISLVARTEDYFEGQIYVKGARKSPECSREYAIEQNSTDLELRIDAQQLLNCGFKAYLKPNSKKMLLSGQVIISFHRDLVTPSDRAFRAHCEFDDFKKNADVNVEKLIQKHEMIVGKFEMPRVSMSVLPAGEESLAKEESQNELKVLKVGDPIIFRWKLENEISSVFGIQLDRCSAETADGKGMRIIENGCSLDEELISDATYSSDSSRIFANSLAFKFPEDHVVYIRCAVRTCVRRMEHLRIIDGSEEDLCSAEQECGLNSRNRRQLGNNSRTDIIFVNGRFRIEKHRMFEHLRTPSESGTSSDFCMPDAIYYVGVSSVIVCYLATISTTVFFQWGRKRN